MTPLRPTPANTPRPTITVRQAVPPHPTEVQATLHCTQAAMVAAATAAAAAADSLRPTLRPPLQGLDTTTIWMISPMCPPPRPLPGARIAAVPGP